MMLPSPHWNIWTGGAITEPQPGHLSRGTSSLLSLSSSALCCSSSALRSSCSLLCRLSLFFLTIRSFFSFLRLSCSFLNSASSSKHYRPLLLHVDEHHVLGPVEI